MMPHFPLISLEPSLNRCWHRLVRKAAHESIEKVMAYLAELPKESFPALKTHPAPTLGRDRKPVLEVISDHFDCEAKARTNSLHFSLKKSSSSLRRDSWQDVANGSASPPRIISRNGSNSSVSSAAASDGERKQPVPSEESPKRKVPQQQPAPQKTEKPAAPPSVIMNFPVFFFLHYVVINSMIP